MTAPDETGLLNIAIEDALAHATTEMERHIVLCAAMKLVTEYLAREMGRRATQEVIRALAVFVHTARPVKPWPP